MLAAALAALLLAAPPKAPPPPPPPSPPSLGTEARAASPLAGEWPEQPSGKKVSLTEKMSIDRALEKIADASGWALVANTGSTGDRVLVLKLKEVPVESALRAVLQGTSLVATRIGGTVTVAPRVAPSRETPVLAGFGAPSGKKVTARYSDTPVGKALRDISKQAGWSIVLPPGLRGTVTAQFDASPAEEALKAVLAQANLTAARDGSVVTVSRESGPRVVVRGSRKQLVFDGDAIADRIGQMVDDAAKDAEDAVQDAEAAAREGRDAAADASAEGRGKVVGVGSTNRNDRVKRGDVVVEPGQRRRDVVAIMGSVRLSAGSSARQVTAILGSVELEPGATVEQEVVAIGGNVHVSPGASVGADAVAVGGEVIIDPGGNVAGEQVSVDVPGLGGLLSSFADKGKGAAKLSPWFRVGGVIAKIVVYFILGLLAMLIVPARLDRITANLTVSPAKATLTGLLGTLALPVLTILLIATVVGIPLIAVQVVAVLVAAIVGYTALALLVGRAIPWRPARGATVAPLAIGVLAIVAVSEIPIVGVLAMMTGWLLAFGAVLRTRFGQPPAVPPTAVETTPVVPAAP